jgi:hypothetical protein
MIKFEVTRAACTTLSGTINGWMVEMVSDDPRKGQRARPMSVFNTRKDARQEAERLARWAEQRLRKAKGA